jgi:hypothetical protein
MRYATDTIPVCLECEQAETQQIKLCEKCGISYCMHYASNIDVRFCSNCMDDFKVIETIETKIVEHLNDANEVTSRRKYICKSLSLTGTDWLFTTHKIKNLTDEQLTDTIEYHREIASEMLLERETRKVERYKNLAQVTLNLPKRQNVDSTGAVKQTRTRSSKKEPDANAVATAIGVLLGAAATPEKIAEILKSLGK